MGEDPAGGKSIIPAFIADPACEDADIGSSRLGRQDYLAEGHGNGCVYFYAFVFQFLQSFEIKSDFSHDFGKEML